MTITAQPQWIVRMFAGKVGRDHLGLGSVSSDQILPSLSPGINVLTLYPRYFSFYVFLLDEFWQREYRRSDAVFSEFYRPRECIFSIGAHLCDQPEHDLVRTIIGSQKTNGLAAQHRAIYDPGFDYIKSPLGGYGLYYRSVMAELEVIYPGGAGLPYPLDVPSERGRMLAAAFRQAIQHTTYYREYFNQPTRPVPLQSFCAPLSSATNIRARAVALNVSRYNAQGQTDQRWSIVSSSTPRLASRMPRRPPQSSKAGCGSSICPTIASLRLTAVVLSE